MEKEKHHQLWVIFLSFKSLFVIDVEENIIKKDSDLSFTLKVYLKNSDPILLFINKQTIIFCKNNFGGQKLSNFSKSFIIDEP